MKKKLPCFIAVISIVLAAVLGTVLIINKSEWDGSKITMKNVSVKDQKLSKPRKTEKTLKKPLNKNLVKANNPNEKVAYLTFDDGPSYNTPILLDILKASKVKATFFIAANSQDTVQKREWLKREAEEGHTIGVHSWTHKYSYIYKSEGNFFCDFNRIENMITSATGEKPKFIRFPGGTDNTVSLKINGGRPIMPKLVRDVEKKGLTPVDWNVGGMDATNPVPSKYRIIYSITNECRYRKNAVILLHDSGPHASSVAAVPEIIKRLRAMGFTFKPLTPESETLMHKPAVGYLRK